MSLAANTLPFVACALGGGIIGYAIRDWRAHRPQVKHTVEQAARIFDAQAPSANGVPPYGVTPVVTQCVKPSCRALHPDADVVLIGIGVSGSAYQCRHCGETW